MARKRHKPEEIVAKQRQVDVLTAQGTPMADAIRSIGVTEVTAKTAYIAPGSPWENGWRRHYNTVRPHESLGYRPPAPEVFVPALAAWPSARLGSALTAMLPQASRLKLN